MDAAFLERAIKEFIATNPANRFPVFGGEPIFDEPLVGFADGDDPLFTEYKTVMGDFHLTPREALTTHLGRRGEDTDIPRLNVISFVLPITRSTRLSMYPETQVPSVRWNLTRWYGQDCLNKLSRYVVYLLEKAGHRAAAPDLTEAFEVKDLPNGRASNWSQRHMAYAAGLGTFSLTDALITPKGVAMRCSSVVTDLALPPTPRTYAHFRANCLFYREGNCQKCAQRCPVGAISEKGHDKKRCRDFLFTEQMEILKKLGRTEGYYGRYLGCGLCQTKVPCEDRIPASTKKAE